MCDRRLIGALISVALLGASVGAAPPAIGTLQEAESARAAFLQGVETYVALHRRLEKGLAPEVVTDDLEALFAPRRELSREIRRARARARQGEIFAPAVASYLRQVIAGALRRGGIDDFLSMVEEENEVTVVPTVNGDYPAGASISFMPPCLLDALPPLPKELEYRFLGRDLILWDLHAGLIVDFLPKAFKAKTATPCGI
jgi:hypothetical protein